MRNSNYTEQHNMGRESHAYLNSGKLSVYIPALSAETAGIGIGSTITVIKLSENELIIRRKSAPVSIIAQLHEQKIQSNRDEKEIEKTKDAALRLQKKYNRIMANREKIYGKKV